jgi:ribosomal protein S18 acetylase RimI-like enzyme
MVRNTIIRAFDDSLADAEGLLAVERATFDESPYSPEQVQAMLAAGPQRAWLAIAGGQIVGFCIGFATCGLRGACWEIDLLAVDAGWTGRGLASRLIRAAATHGARVARQTRAVVATDNDPSARAFARVGFRRARTCELLLFRPGRPIPHPGLAPGFTVREAASVAQAAAWLPDSLPLGTRHSGLARLENCPEQGAPTLLLAEYKGQPAGYAELIEVQTLLYHGLWIESLAASTPTARVALLHDILRRAVEADLDEIGSMVPEGNRPLRQAFASAGFRSQGDFYWLEARLPLPGIASLPVDSHV